MFVKPAELKLKVCTSVASELYDLKLCGGTKKNPTDVEYLCLDKPLNGYKAKHPQQRETHKQMFKSL